MRGRRALSLLAVLLGGPAATAAALACELQILGARDGQLRWRGAMPPGARIELHFVHSVLGTPVADRYRWQHDRWVLEEERFEGLGYGLPHQAGPGERLLREGDGWRLLLQREVDPLVVRTAPAHPMRLVAAGLPMQALETLGRGPWRIAAQGCEAVVSEKMAR